MPRRNRSKSVGSTARRLGWDGATSRPGRRAGANRGRARSHGCFVFVCHHHQSSSLQRWPVVALISGGAVGNGAEFGGGKRRGCVRRACVVRVGGLGGAQPYVTKVRFSNFFFFFFLFSKRGEIAFAPHFDLLFFSPLLLTRLHPSNRDRRIPGT